MSANMSANFIPPFNLNDSYYKILGVNENATQDEINKAFRKMALRYHPDRAGAKSDDIMKIISAANEVLKDPIKRREYDARKGLDTDFDGEGENFATEISGALYGGPKLSDIYRKKFDDWLKKGPPQTDNIIFQKPPHKKSLNERKILSKLSKKSL